MAVLLRSSCTGASFTKSAQRGELLGSASNSIRSQERSFDKDVAQQNLKKVPWLPGRLSMATHSRDTADHIGLSPSNRLFRSSCKVTSDYKRPSADLQRHGYTEGWSKWPHRKNVLHPSRSSRCPRAAPQRPRSLPRCLPIASASPQPLCRPPRALKQIFLKAPGSLAHGPPVPSTLGPPLRSSASRTSDTCAQGPKDLKDTKFTSSFFVRCSEHHDDHVQIQQ